MRFGPVAVFALLCSFSPQTALCQGGSGSDGGEGVQLRFANFETAPIGRFPYICSLRRNDNREKHVCGGILVHASWVLTAAHCVDPSTPGSPGLVPIIYCGIHDINDSGADDVFAAVDGILHENWTGDAKKGYDIAMLKLDIEASATLPRLNVRNSRPEPGTPLDGLGWGETAGGRSADKLQLAENLIAVSHRVCNDRWDGQLNEDIMLCAGIGENDACKGDSGGPLLHADAPGGDVADGNPRLDLIIGIVSFGDGSCGTSTKPGVFTDVGYFREWISAVIEGRQLTPSPSPPARSTPSPSPPARSTPSPSTRTFEVKDVVDAIRRDDADTVRAALDSGLDPASRYSDSTVSDGDADLTLLHWTARFGAPESAKVLIEFGVDLDPKNDISNTPLHYCGFYGTLDVAEVLVENGADLEAVGSGGFTPLHYAARAGRPKVAEFLIESGADLESIDSSGNTPLMQACIHGHADVVKVLLDGGAMVNARQRNDFTPLHFAALNDRDRVIEVLLDNGADIDAKNVFGETPLHRAAHRGYSDSVEVLLLRGAEVDAVTLEETTPLHSTTFQGDFVDAAQLLVNNGANVNAKDENRTSVLHYAARNNRIGIVRLLLRSGAEVDATDDDDETPLHQAAYRGHSAIVEILIEAGADVDAKDDIGETPLHEASEYGFPDVAEALVGAGASKTIRDRDGDRPSDVICSRSTARCTSATRSRLEDLLAP